MSRTLARLRKTFGDPLFVRTATGLRPTPRAKSLAPALKEMLRRAEALVAGPPRFDPAKAERTFAISTADYVESVLLLVLLRRLTEEAPGVRLRITTQPQGFDGALDRGELDLAWTLRQPGPRGVVWTRLFDETFTFVVRRGHPVLRGGPFTLERYLSLRHLAIAPSAHSDTNPLDETLARLRHRRNIVATVPSFLVVPSLLLDSDVGVTLPRRLVSAVAARYGLTAVPMPFELRGFSIHQAWHERMRKDPGHAWLRKVVAEVGRVAAREAAPGEAKARSMLRPLALRIGEEHVPRAT